MTTTTKIRGPPRVYTKHTTTALRINPSLYVNALNHVSSTCNHQQYEDGCWGKTVFVSKWRRWWHVYTVTIQRRVLTKDRLCILTPPITWPTRETTNNPKTGVCEDRLCILMPPITWPTRETTNNPKTGIWIRPSLDFKSSNHVAATWKYLKNKNGLTRAPSLYTRRPT